MATAAEIKRAADRSVKAMQARPSLAQYTYRNRANIKDGLACECTEGDWSLRLDVPKAVGGEHLAPSPGVFVRTALTSCIAIGIKIAASRSEVPIDEVSVDLEVDADNRADFGVDDVPPGYQRFRVNINVASPSDPAKVEDVVNKSLKVSPLIALHNEPQDMTISISVDGGTMAAE